jgi:hypothetical protein
MLVRPFLLKITYVACWNDLDQIRPASLPVIGSSNSC